MRAARSQRYFFAHRPALNRVGAQVKCRLLSVRPRHCLVECYSHDINLPDGTVCMCNYSYRHEASDFMVGDTVIIVVQRFETEKRQMYGKIMSKW